MLFQKLKKIFGEECYKDNVLDRKYLGNIVFANKGKLQSLNSIVHPVVNAKIQEWINNQTSKYCIIESALVFETYTNNIYDLIIGIEANDHVRLDRVIARDNCTKEEAINKMSNQMRQHDKMWLCDASFVNETDSIEIVESIMKFIANQYEVYNGMSELINSDINYTKNDVKDEIEKKFKSYPVLEKINIYNKYVGNIASVAERRFYSNKISIKLSPEEYDGWECKNSPDGVCHYYSNKGTVHLNNGDAFKLPDDHDKEDESEDCCLFCGQPEERK